MQSHFPEQKPLLNFNSAAAWHGLNKCKVCAEAWNSWDGDVVQWANDHPHDIVPLEDDMLRSIPEALQALHEKETEQALTHVDGHEIVRQPDHYTKFKIEPITFIMENHLSFEIGNVVKYAVRAGSKLYSGKTAVESEIIDLEKARRYAEMRINQLQGKTVL